MAVVDFEKSVSIDASADKVWKIIGKENFNNISEWVGNVKESRGLSAEELQDAAAAGEHGGRVCTVEGVGQITEKLFEYDDPAKQLAFTLEGKPFPFFMKRVENRWKITEEGDENKSCVATFAVRVDLLPVCGCLSGRLKNRLESKSGLFADELKYFAENDKPLSSTK